MPLDQRSVLGKTPVTHWLSALSRGQEGTAAGAKDGSVNRAFILSTLDINYTTHPQWAKAVFDATDKRGVDVVFENVAAATRKDSISSL